MITTLWKSLTLILTISSFSSTSVSTSSYPFPFWSSATESFLLEALGWLTLRDNGVLLDRSTLSTTWIPVFKEKYEASLPYRLKLTAFQYGVIPKLTSGENEDCNSTYTFIYKHWYNDSVLIGHLTNYIFDTFYESVWNLPQGPFVPEKFCDYRQGLRCNPTTNKCQCPSGSVMSPVSGAASPSTRCLLQENEICALLDTQADNTNDIDNPFRTEILQMIFNFDKPIGCQDGTQCRFQAGNMASPLCYTSSASPAWIPGPKAIVYGEECTLDLYGIVGMCASQNDDQLGPVSCYNYGLSPKNSTGMCSYSSGVYGGAVLPHPRLGRYTDPFVMAYLTPRFLPIRGQKLQNYLQAIADFIKNFEKIRSSPKNNRYCKISRTEKLDDLYKFYFSLKNAPVQGQIYVATEAELDTKLIEAQALVSDWDTTSERICKVSGYDLGYETCLTNGNATDGNDGRCRTSGINDQPEFYGDEKAFFRKLGLTPSEMEEFTDYRITKYMVEECSTGGGPGFSCPENYICWEDYNDLQPEPLYDGVSCNLKVDKVKRTCHELGPDVWKHFGGCEMKILREKVETKLDRMFAKGYKRLRMGAPCNHEVDQVVWAALLDTLRNNGYHFLALDPTYSAVDDGFCDRSRLLECKSDDKCGCRTGMAPRFTEGAGQISDYCYFTEGSCAREDIPDLGYFFPEDLAEVKDHYGDPSNIITGPVSQYAPCSNGNQCVFTNEVDETCTDVNTGKTRVAPSPRKILGRGGDTPRMNGRPKKHKAQIEPPAMFRDGASLSLWFGNNAALLILFSLILTYLN